MRIVIPGNPIAKMRPRFARKGKSRMVYNAQETEEGRFLFEVQKQWGQQRIREGALKVICTFYMLRPKSHYGTGKNSGKLKPSAPEYPLGKRNDIDNLLKFTLDCLNGVAWKDDCQIIILEAWKVYPKYSLPRTEIFIEEKR